jgi:hypothetical protein
MGRRDGGVHMSLSGRAGEPLRGCKIGVAERVSGFVLVSCASLLESLPRPTRPTRPTRPPSPPNHKLTLSVMYSTVLVGFRSRPPCPFAPCAFYPPDPTRCGCVRAGRSSGLECRSEAVYVPVCREYALAVGIFTLIRRTNESLDG